MITLTRLSGKPFVLNSDLIERIDSTPDTVVTLTDGTKYVVADSMADVTAAVRRFRSEIVALSWQVDPLTVSPEPAAPTPTGGHLAPVTTLPGAAAAATADAPTDGQEL